MRSPGPSPSRSRRARAVQQERLRRARGIYSNAHMTSRHIKRHCGLDGEAADLLETAMERLSLSARAYDRILKVARIIADLELPNGSCRVAHLPGLLAGGG